MTWVTQVFGDGAHGACTRWTHHGDEAKVEGVEGDWGRYVPACPPSSPSTSSTVPSRGRSYATLVRRTWRPILLKQNKHSTLQSLLGITQGLSILDVLLGHNAGFQPTLTN